MYYLDLETENKYHDEHSQGKHPKDKTPKERWQVATKFTKYFDVPDLSPSSLLKVANEVYYNDEKTYEFFYYKTVFGPG